MKSIYIAAPFFNETQLATVKSVEGVIKIFDHSLDCYSPRNDGVLQNMTPEKRAASYESVYRKNVEMIETCDLLLAIVDAKDTGTIWEMGYARGFHGHKNMSFNIFTFSTSPHIKTNVMLGQSTDGHINGLPALQIFLQCFYCCDGFAPEFLPARFRASTTREQF